MEPEPCYILLGNEGPITSLHLGKVNDTSCLLSGTQRGFAVLWNLANKRAIIKEQVCQNSVLRVYLNDESTILQSRDGFLNFYKITEDFQLINNGSMPCSSNTFCPFDVARGYNYWMLLVPSTDDPAVCSIIDIREKRVLFELEPRDGSKPGMIMCVQSERSDPVFRVFIGHERGSIYAWSLLATPPVLLHRFEAHTEMLTSLNFCWRREVGVSSSADGVLRLWSHGNGDKYAVRRHGDGDEDGVRSRSNGDNDNELNRADGEKDNLRNCSAQDNDSDNDVLHSREVGDTGVPRSRGNEDKDGRDDGDRDGRRSNDDGDQYGRRSHDDGDKDGRRSHDDMNQNGRRSHDDDGDQDGRRSHYDGDKDGRRSHDDGDKDGRRSHDDGNEAGGFASLKSVSLDKGVSSVCIRDDGRIVAAGVWDGTVRVFTGKKLRPLVRLEASGVAVNCVRFEEKTGVLFAGGADGFVSCWRLYEDSYRLD